MTRRRGVVFVIVAALAGAASGCGAPSGNPVAVLGTGIDRFAPLEEGAVVPIHAGYQGGFHIAVHLRCRDVAPGGVHVVFEGAAEQDGAAACAAAYPRLDLRRAEDEWFELPAGGSCFVPDPSALVGRRIRIVGRLTSSNERVVSDERVVVAGAIVRPY